VIHAPQARLFDRRFARRLWKLTRIYWTSPDARWGGLLLGLAIALELGTVYGFVVMSEAQRSIFDALQEKHASAFFAAFGLFFGLMSFFLLVSSFRIYVRQRLEIRWRRWLTEHFVERWVTRDGQWLLSLHGSEVDNPDQRIAEDVRSFVASALGLSLSLLSALTTLLSFAGLLWALSGDWTFPIGGTDVAIPGFLMWVAVAYAVIATWITHRIGRPLVPIHFDRLRVEADFRFTLVHFRENAETVALSRGDAHERRTAHDRFGRVVDNWGRLIRAQLRLTLLTTGIGQANGVVPLLVAAPGFFLGQLTLGSVEQTRIAYGQVSAALTWFVAAYQEIAQWRASIERLCVLSEAIDTTRAELARADGLEISRSADGGLQLSGVHLELPNGRVLIEDANASVAPGDQVRVLGPSGTGQTTLVRAIAGLWPFARGRIETPPPEQMMFVPQRPYLPIGTLRAVVSFPAEEGSIPDEEIRHALEHLGLRSLADRLDERELWEQRLSAGEQQRLALARALLQRPSWLLLDDATSALDAEMEERAYRLLREELPGATTISIAHRASGVHHPMRSWTLARENGACRLHAD
jgi:putative ATP-binding cassette transporter